MAQIPDLLQLCAEQVSIYAKRNRKIRKHLVQVQFPKVDISYIKKKIYKTCDFSRFTKTQMGSSRIVPSKAKMCENYDFTLSVGSEKVLYVSTISDLGVDMLKLDFPEGEYGLSPFCDGYVLKKRDYSPKLQDAIHLFNSRDSERGLAGTYWEGHTDNVNHLRLFNQFISEYYIPKKWCEEVPKYRAVVDSLEDYNNIPVIFYLTKNLNLDDLNKITLTCPSVINNCGNVEVCWYVFHSEKGRIGIAVKQRNFFNMMGAYAGLCLFASDGFRSAGNFDYDFTFAWPCSINEWGVCDPYHSYECEFVQCFCEIATTRELNSRLKLCKSYYDRVILS